MPSKIKKSKKIEAEIEIESEDEALHCDTDPEDVDDDSTTSDEEVKATTSRTDQRERRRAESDRIARTVFVGNLPATFTKKKLLKLFKNALRADLEVVKSGCSVESVRLRGAVPITGGTSNQARKRSSIQHDFAAGEDHTQLGFVVLSSIDGIPAALKMNGHCLSEGDTDLSGRHIRVNMCTRKKSSTSASSVYSTQKSVFVGNLSFSTNEEQVRNAFSKFGTIANVRLVRDSITGAVKGIGFVEFESPDSVSLAVRASDSVEICQRRVRIQPWKSIKKTKTHRGGFPQKNPQMQQGSQAGNNIVVPSNLRGLERQKFVKRAFGRRQKRRVAELVKPTSKTIKKTLKKKVFGKADSKKINKKEKKRRAEQI